MRGSRGDGISIGVKGISIERSSGEVGTNFTGLPEDISLQWE